MILEASVEKERLTVTQCSTGSSTAEDEQEWQDPDDSEVPCLQESGEDELDAKDEWDSGSSASETELVVGLDLVYAPGSRPGSYQADPSDEVSLSNILSLVQAGFPSYGSVNHEAWQCKPCDFTVHRRRTGRSCRFGVMCMCCHGFHRRKVVSHQAHPDYHAGLIANVVFAI